MSYTLDSNILINLVQRYPRDIFPGIWDSIEESVAQGDSCISQAVHREVDRGGDDLHEWADDLPGFVCLVTDEELATVAEIGAAHPGWVQGQLNEADPFVVAHAKHESSTVVTEEKRKGPGTHDKNLKIPNVADEHEVEVLKFFDYVRREGWSF
ncbi:hypothetical protein AUQ48_15920 [Kocuria flava]|uniref:DUF4411 family protein n=1 Tax=Kocuria flava TaxID=446860 RepID=A0A2N4SXV5_9MICC|nr:DUF4411 family protein [Kocuria flava]PLC10811.1 hypothetical protein AUQ48_15920 [Kocuria flava]